MTIRLANLPADAETLLEQFAVNLQAAFDAANLGISVPARQYLNPGAMIAWDEPQLTIALIRIYMGEPGAPESLSVLPGMIHQSASFGIVYVDQVPGLQADGTFPSTEALDAAGRYITSLVPIFWSTAVAIRTEGILKEGGSTTIGPLSTVGPEGFLAGISIQLDASVL